ncbi:MAG: alpha-galactosidase, partial [Clostridiales bacterium]|nr:alpha-galactosidase [Clostridiales bacterium]
YRHWYGLLAALRARYPDLYIEGCASGGMRADLAAMFHFDGFFLSDNVNHYDVEHISQGAMLRLPPGKLERWAVMRTADGLPEYPKPIEDSAARTIVPKEATWDNFLTVDPSFPLAVGLMGILGFSGDVHHMSERARALSRQAVAVFRTYRALLRNAVGYLLTPEAPFGRNDVWVGTQRSSGDVHLVYAFRMDARAARCTLHPRGLESGATYTLRRIFPEDGGVRTATGEQWMANGVPVALEPGCAAVYLLARQSASNPGRGK